VYARCGRYPDDPLFDSRRHPPPGDGHWAPAEGCRCGIYAFKSPADAARMLTRFAYGRYRVLPKEPTFASGVVELAGQVIEHEFGYRAERARIVTIIPVQWRPFPLESDVTIGARHPTAPSTYQLAADVGRRALRLRLRGRRPREGDAELLARLLFRP
jgi:hypothetical protein